MMSKLGKWKYSLDQLPQQIPKDLLQEIKPRWENARKIAKDIFEQTLRNLMLSLSEKEVKESLKKNEEKFTLKFNTYLVLMKDIESMVKSTTTTWKKIYNLQQSSDFIIHVSEKDDKEDDEEDVEIEDVNLDDKEEG